MKMKKILFPMALMAFFATANAQVWIGGSVGYNANSTKTVVDNNGTETKSEPVTRTLSISPKIGIQMSDDVEIGAMMTFASSKTFSDKKSSYNNWDKTTSWAVTPFCRYSFASFGNLTLKAVTDLSFGQSIPKSSRVVNQETQKSKGHKTTELAINIYPMMTYSLSDHCELEAGLNFFGLSATKEFSKYDNPVTSSTDKVTKSSFGLSYDSDDVLQPGLITIGFIYKL